MATNAEVEWASCVKPLIAASYSTFNKNNLPSLVEAIIKSEPHILNHNDEYECFYSSFVALATHYICATATQLCKSSLNNVLAACKVLLKFLLRRLQKHNNDCTISQKYLMLLVKSLCKGSSSLPKSDILTFTALLKSAAVPPNIKTGPETEDSTETKELDRPRLDTGRNIFSQLTSVFEDITSQSKVKSDGPVESINSDGDKTIVHIQDPSEEVKVIFANKNIIALQQLNSRDALLDVCCELVYLKRYMTYYQDAVTGGDFVMPTSLGDATAVRSSLQSLLSDISIVWRAFSLPILEPLTPARLEKISCVALSCLYAAITAAASSSIVTMTTGIQGKSIGTGKDEELDGYAASIVQKSLEILTFVSNAIRSSTRAGGHNLQNLYMIATWCLLMGLQSLLNLTPTSIIDRGKEAAKAKPADTAKVSKDGQPATKAGVHHVHGTAKGHQGFSVLTVALASHAITLLSSLMEDLQVEGRASRGAGSGHQVVNFSISGQYTASERVQKLTASVPVTCLLFSMLSVAYRRGSSLKKPHHTSESSDSSSSSSSDSNTYYEDDFSSSDDSSAEEDDDSEPILGQWFEETLSPEEHSGINELPPPPTSSEGGMEGKSGLHGGSMDSPQFVPDKKEPDGYIALAADILQFLTSHFLNSPSEEVKKYLSDTLSELHMAGLSAVVKDLDKDYPKNIKGHMYEGFSTALSRFNHCLVATGILSDNLQDSFLTHLGISPSSSDPWPLTVYPRTLAVMAEVLLLRQQKEREVGSIKSKSEAAVINIWTRFMATVKNIILDFDNNTRDFEDVNVEHMQLLLFLFHSLPLMQKKSLLLQLGQTMVTIAEQMEQPGAGSRLTDTVPLPLSRLVLILDYLLHYFYDPPGALMDQVQWNLFGMHTMVTSGNVDSFHKTHFSCSEVQDSYIKNLSSQDSKEGIMKPRFYNLGPTDYNNQDTPKIDGLACSFLLGNPEVLNYNSLYDACVTLLMAGCHCDKAQLRDNFSLLDACSVHYHFIICWRLLSCLPPSAQYLHVLESGTLQLKDSHVLHTLRWAPRLAHKSYSGWVKDCLVKQGMTTQKAEALITSARKVADNVNYDVRLALHFIQDQIAVMPLAGQGEILSARELPSLHSVYMLDAVIAKIQVALDECFTKSMADTDPHKSMVVAQDLLPATFLLIEAYSIYIRSCLLSQVNQNTETPCTATPPALKAYGTVMSIGSSRASKVSVLGMAVMGWLPAPVRVIVEQWNTSSTSEFPPIGAWRNAFANDIIPSENYIEEVQLAHVGTLSGQTSFTPNASLKHLLHSLVRFCGDLILWCPDEKNSKEMVRVIFPLIFDATTEYLADHVTLALERIVGAVDGEEFTAKMYQHVISKCHDILINHSSSESGLDERILHDCLKFMENHLEKSAGKVAFEKFYTEEADLVSLLLSTSSDNLSMTHCTKVLKFFTKLFQLAEKNPTDQSYTSLCTSLGKLAHVDSLTLQGWLGRMIMAPPQNLEDSGKIQENRLLLQSLTSYIVKENSHVGEEVAKAILDALIPMGNQILSPATEGIGFAELMVVMATLAGSGSGSGHAALFQAATGWLELCKSYLSQKDVIEKLQENVSSGKHQTMLESACYLMSYIGDILGSLKQTNERPGAASPPYEGELQTQEADSDWAEDIAQEEDDSAAEDSDEESLNNKLCTFNITQKEFMNQHWYHCHTCKMVDGVGVCTICAKVCHKDHDLTYAKYGSFFCDCGAKEDGSCLAMVKRSPQSGLDASHHHQGPSPFSMETMLPSSLRRRLSSPSPAEKHSETKGGEKVSKTRETLCKQIETYRDTLTTHVDRNNTVNVVLDLLQSLMPSIMDNYQRTSPIGSTARAQTALRDLHDLPKTIENTDQLQTLGSQEGAFENVRMNYSGDQGQTIRQLITSHVLRRVAMCCLTSPQGKRQHLAVSHEKGKITILQLSALLKQADSSKRKLTLTRLSSAPIPFTVLSITGNPCNEDLLAVCGLKDCHVLTFASAGSVADHLVLHPSLETGNFIIKAIWLPGSQTELAIVTADFVKIYDLSHDAISPQFYFLLPSGKIRDATFIFTEEARHMVLMASSGYIYVQPMEEASSAAHGPFYITNILEVKRDDIKEQGGQVAGGGVSVYYSHALQLLFFSYSNGKNFASPVPKDMQELTNIFAITVKSSNGGKSGSNPQPLVQWSEVPNHPGLVCSMTQTANNPVILMVNPYTIQVQEIKVLPAKAKIQDMVAIRHAASNSDQRTTLILLCEDGSLRIYMANVDNTGYWMVPSLQPYSSITVLKPTKKKKVAKPGRPVGVVSFPIDFFEHCQHTNDIEFGGNDILHVYNVAQVKHRLNTTGMYIASTKPGGFTVEINNTNGNHVMVGVRVLVGSQAIERAPSYLEVFGRTTQVNITRARWYDLPFTREESLTADKKFSLFVGASVDPMGATMVDSVKVYMKTKEAFGWPEDSEDFADATAKIAASSSAVSSSGVEEGTVMAPLPLTSMDRLLASSLEVLDGCFATVAGPDDKQTSVRQMALDIATQLLTLPTPSSVQQHTQSLLASLHPNRLAYHNHKDQAQLAHVMHCLSTSKEPSEVPELDPEAFQRLVVTARSVAISRPSNLVRFAEKDTTLVGEPAEQALEVTDLEAEDHKIDENSDSLSSLIDLDSTESQHFVVQLMEAFWKLHASKPANPSLAPVCLPGLTHVEATVAALVEIIHAFAACDLDNINLATKLYTRLLLCDDPAVSFACKQALIRVLRPRHRRRRVFIPSPPRCSTPGAAGGADDDEDDDKPDKPHAPMPTPQEVMTPPAAPQANGEHDPQFEIVEPPEAMVLEPPEGAAHPPNPSPLEALLSGGGSLPPMLDIPPDADDETMVELAIALSLQDQSGHGSGLSLQGLGLGGQGQLLLQGGGSLEGGHFSDTTASAPGSDDEVGSTAATDGSTLRTSPAEHGGSAGSESGGSAVDSISGEHNVSGRSSAYGDAMPESTMTGARSETSSVGMPSGSMHQECEGSEAEADVDTSFRLHTLRLMLLEKLLHYMPKLKDVGGVRAIPFMQVVLMLSSDLDNDEEKDRTALDNLLASLQAHLDIPHLDVSNMAARTETHEVHLIIMRLLSVLMSRTKAGTKPTGESSSFISAHTSLTLLQAGGVDFCLRILRSLLEYWKNVPPDEDEALMPGQLLKARSMTAPPDMSPFFLRQYVKGHAHDVFEAYPQLLTEMVLRLPYQMKKIADSSAAIVAPSFDQMWNQILCEYMMVQQTPFVRRQVRKLLLFICGSKDKYRQLRDMHALDTHMKEVRNMCEKGGFLVEDAQSSPVMLPYDMLISLIEHLKACSEVATSRTVNWQKFCQKEEGVLPFLIQSSIALHEGVAPVLLQLLQCALCGAKALQQSGVGAQGTASPAKQKKDKDKDKNEAEADDGSKHDEALCMALVQHVCRHVNRDLLTKFIRFFLLESNSTSVRWQAHALVLHIYRSSSLAQQEALLDLMWSIWPELPNYGRKAAQFVDLLGYFALKTPQSSEKKCKRYVEKAVWVLRSQNQILACHPNGNIYNMLQGLVEFDGYYLESDPCLVCNNPEVPYSNIKLSSIKVDSKFTTTTQIVKLVGSHNIARVNIKISDLKRTKMVRTINIYYNNRSVQAVVELRNKPGLWHKAKKVSLSAGQNEVKVEFPLPIVACNLMIEYADFYDNFQASAETLQCPRCSASVPANPGVCGNCGENVFQCHKCRAINYDEKDPFLCNACGFCKYAKFDFSLYGKPCCAVDPIENDDDRKKAVSTINSLLEKADRLYKQIQLNRPAMESLLLRVHEHSTDRGLDDQVASNNQGSNVNKAIQQLAQRYSVDCKTTFDELSKIIQKVLASRKELVEYDRQQREAALAAALPGSTPTTPTISPSSSALLMKAKETPPVDPRAREKSGHCFGCASATVEHCITLLRALATNANMRQIFCGQGLIKELVDFNLRRGSSVVRSDVRNLVCLLTKDNSTSTHELNTILMSRIMAAVKGHLANPDLTASVRHEVTLLASTVQREDTCWEQRIRCVLQLFLVGIRTKSPVVMENIALPCLRILHHIIKPEAPTSKKNKDKPTEALGSVRTTTTNLHADAKAWLAGDPKASFQAWKHSMPRKAAEVATKRKRDDKTKERERDRDLERRVVRVKYLMEKYGHKWKNKVNKEKSHPLKIPNDAWLRQAMFSSSSRATRQTVCNIIEGVCLVPNRKQEILDLLTGYLDELGHSGESAAEFLSLYKKLVSPAHWQLYLAIKGVLPRIGRLITQEIDKLTVLEDTTLSSDLSQGYALKALTELLSSFIEQDILKQHYKSRLVGTVLNGYLSLRRLVVQRTKLIDETQDKLLELLEEMTTGTESEAKEFMAVCVQTVQKYGLDDLRSPVFIFERLCSIIYPEENDVGEFFLSLEKDPQQEDFLQGRMLGNPYSSNEPGLGPLMRDVKNKICQDCELVALLEDDTGMELLVNNKIISLELPVKDVYKKVWVPEHGEGEAMRVVYRMRGLLGDATEDMVNSLDTGGDEDVDNEEVYKMANVMSECDGLTVMLQRLAAIRDLVTGKPLMMVLLKLFSFCVKVKSNRLQLIKTEMNTINIMLGALNLALLAEQESGTSTKGQTLTEQILQIMETILLEASGQSPETHKVTEEFSKLCGDHEQLMMLLDRINSPFVRANAPVLQALMRLIPFLAFGDRDKMLTLINHFKPYVNFNRFDFEHTQDELIHLDCFCVIANGIEKNANGNKLKDLMLEHEICKDSMEYIQMHAPEVKTLLATDSENWKEFISKPALPYCLRLLTGLCRGHENTQLMIGKDLIQILHKLEQVSSDEHIGSLAENLMEALREHPQAAAKIEDIRQQTKAEKKKLAMAKRQKQLGALGMTTNEKGQVTVKSSVLKQMEELKEETGLVCCICREGYRYQPTKVLGIYTFTKRCNLEDFENKQRKLQGNSTVSHFNIIHVECHLAAVRHARGREEWESAALQNANTKCNGLLPLWGPQVPESAFASCLARHNTYLQECTGIRDGSYAFTVHDLKLLMLRFAEEKSFSEESGGGGRQSNMHLVPYMMHMALYVMNTTRSVAREEKNLNNFLKSPTETWVESSYEAEGPLYWTMMAAHIFNKEKWKANRVIFLKRLLVLAHARAVSPGGSTTLTDKTPKEYSVYKMYLVFFALVDGIFNILLKKLSVSADGSWPSSVAEYLRHNDQTLLEQGDKLLSSFEEEVLPCESFLEFFDVLDLLQELSNPFSFIPELLSSIP